MHSHDLYSSRENCIHYEIGVLVSYGLWIDDYLKFSYNGSTVYCVQFLQNVIEVKKIPISVGFPSVEYKY